MAASSFFCFLGFRVKVASFLKLVPFVDSFFGNCLVEVLATGGCFSNYSANVLEALHKLLCKDPWRNSSGIGACLCSPHCFVLSSDSFCNIGQDQQVINYVTRHQTMQDHKQFIALLFPDSQKDDQPQEPDYQTTPL